MKGIHAKQQPYTHQERPRTRTHRKELAPDRNQDADGGRDLRGAAARRRAPHTGTQIDTPGILRMHGTAGRAAHLARTLMMVALLPRGLIGGLGEDPDAISYPESKHAST